MNRRKVHKQQRCFRFWWHTLRAWKPLVLKSQTVRTVCYVRGGDRWKCAVYVAA